MLMSDEHDELIAWRNRFPEYMFDRDESIVRKRAESRNAVTPARAHDSNDVASKAGDPVSETDWGQGVGGREKPIDPQEFRDELSDLRDRTTEKRNRRGMP